MSRAGRALLVCVSVSIRDSKLPNVRSLVGDDDGDNADDADDDFDSDDV